MSDEFDSTEEYQLVRKGINGFLRKIYAVVIMPEFSKATEKQFILLTQLLRIPEKLMTILIELRIKYLEHNEAAPELYNAFLYNYFESPHFPQSGNELPYPATVGDHLVGFLEIFERAFGSSVFEKFWQNVNQILTYSIEFEAAFLDTPYQETYLKVIEREKE